MTYVTVLLLMFVGPFVYVINSEAVLLGALAFDESISLSLLAFCGAVGGAAAFLVYYLFGNKLVDLSRRLREKTDKIDMDKFRQRSVVVIFTSSAFSLPPVTATAVVAGILRYSWWRFTLICLVGRFTRWMILASIGGPLVPWVKKTLSAYFS